MTVRRESTNTVALPYSGRIIGTIVKALSLDDGVLTSRTAQRFFKGQSVSEHNHGEIFLALGDVLVERGIVPLTPTFQQYGISLSEFIAIAIARAATRWDGLLAEVQSKSARIGDRSIAADRLLQFVVIDLSVRIFALLRLSGIDPERPGVPLWAQENGGGKLLRNLTARAGLTREELAKQLGVSSTSVDNWLDGKVRPTNDSVAALSEVLADEIRDVTPDHVRMEIQRQFTFVTLVDLVELWIGRQRVIELSTALTRFVWMMTEDVREMDRPPLDEVAGIEFDAARFGTADPATHTLLRNLAILEQDEEWRQDLLAATLPWELLFQRIMVQSNPTRSAAGLAQDVADWTSSSRTEQSGLGKSLRADDPARDAISQLGDEGPGAQVRFGAGGLAAVVRMFDTDIERRRAIVKSFPLSPDAHYQLGSFLGMVGKWSGERELVDEGITECKIAVALLPCWDAPAVEPGIILGNIGAYEEALVELERARETLPEETPHFCFVMGYVLMKMSRYTEALGYLERVLEVRPDYAQASLHAARCAFMLGDKRKGQRHAKTARRLGEPGAYIAWRAGAYSSRKSG